MEGTKIVFGRFGEIGSDPKDKKKGIEGIDGFETVVFIKPDTEQISLKNGILFIKFFINVASSGKGKTMLARRERGSARIDKLKDKLASAYLTALEDSVLNPLRGGLR